MYTRVIPFQKTFDSQGLIYFVPEHLRPDFLLYQIVTIPLRDTLEIAVAVQILPELPDDIDISKIKSLVDIYNPDRFLLAYQAQTIDFIASQYITPIHNALWVFFPKNLREKISKNTLHKVSPRAYSYSEIQNLTLSNAQQQAYSEIQNTSQKNVLLYGITGSGKTEIYKKIIAENLKNDTQTLLLIPEIILGDQIGQRIRDCFGPDVLVISSSVTEAEKTQYWVDIRSGNAKVIVGTRSALFYPYSCLWSIIIDEEHDRSYVSDSAPRYNSIEIALYMSHILKIPTILASGTPSIERMYRAMKGEYQLVNLLEKYDAS